MNYSYNTILKNHSFEQAILCVKDELKKEGFGVLTEIDMKETLREKLGVDFKRYTILGACHPQFAYQALLLEDKLGVFMPCNVVISEHKEGGVEVSIVDPIAQMNSVENPALGLLVGDIQQKLARVVAAIMKLRG